MEICIGSGVGCRSNVFPAKREIRNITRNPQRWCESWWKCEELTTNSNKRCRFERKTSAFSPLYTLLRCTHRTIHSPLNITYNQTTLHTLNDTLQTPLLQTTRVPVCLLPCLGPASPHTEAQLPDPPHCTPRTAPAAPRQAWASAVCVRALFVRRLRVSGVCVCVCVV